MPGGEPGQTPAGLPACTWVGRGLLDGNGQSVLTRQRCEVATRHSSLQVCRVSWGLGQRGAPAFFPVVHGEGIQFLARSVLTLTMATGLAFWRTKKSEMLKPIATPNCRLPLFTAACRDVEVHFIWWASS